MPWHRPKNRLEKITSRGWDMPREEAAMAMKPRPEVMFSVNMVTWPMLSAVPPRPHRAPESTTTAIWMRVPLVPRLSAASLLMPTDSVR